MYIYIHIFAYIYIHSYMCIYMYINVCILLGHAIQAWMRLSAPMALPNARSTKLFGAMSSSNMPLKMASGLV